MRSALFPLLVLHLQILTIAWHPPYGGHVPPTMVLICKLTNNRHFSKTGASSNSTVGRRATTASGSSAVHCSFVRNPCSKKMEGQVHKTQAWCLEISVKQTKLVFETSAPNLGNFFIQNISLSQNSILALCNAGDSVIK